MKKQLPTVRLIYLFGSYVNQQDNEQGKFEMQVMSMYQNLNEKRADILHDFMGNA